MNEMNDKVKKRYGVIDVKKIKAFQVNENNSFDVVFTTQNCPFEIAQHWENQ